MMFWKKRIYILNLKGDMAVYIAKNSILDGTRRKAMQRKKNVAIS